MSLLCTCVPQVDRRNGLGQVSTMPHRSLSYTRRKRRFVNFSPGTKNVQALKKRHAFRRMPTAKQFAHHLRLLTLLTSACLTLPPLLNSPFLGADIETSIDDIPPSAADTFGAVIVLGEMLGRMEGASREKMRVGAGLIDALVLGRRISRRSYAGIWYAAEGVEVRVGRGDLSRSRRGVEWGSSTL